MTTKLLTELRPSAESPRPGAAAPARRELAGHAAALALIALLVPLRGLWAVQVLLVPLLLVVPGVVLLRALRVPGRAVASFPVYVPCASVVVLFASGLAVDLAGPLVGVAAPLRTGPLLAGLEIICLALLAASARAPSDVAIPWRSLTGRTRCAWPVLVALAAAAGALRLNSGHGNAIAAIALAACAVILVAGLVFASRLDTTLLAVALYAAELAMMWSYLAARQPRLRLRHRHRVLRPAAGGGHGHLAHGPPRRCLRRDAQRHRHAGRAALPVRRARAARAQGRLPGDRRAVPGGHLLPGTPGPVRPLGLRGGRLLRHAGQLRAGTPGDRAAGDRPRAVRRAARGDAGILGSPVAAVGSGRPSRPGDGPCPTTPPPTWPSRSSASPWRCSGWRPGSGGTSPRSRARSRSRFWYASRELSPGTGRLPTRPRRRCCSSATH